MHTGFSTIVIKLYVTSLGHYFITKIYVFALSPFPHLHTSGNKQIATSSLIQDLFFCFCFLQKTCHTQQCSGLLRFSTQRSYLQELVGPYGILGIKVALACAKQTPYPLYYPSIPKTMKDGKELCMKPHQQHTVNNSRKISIYKYVYMGREWVGFLPCIWLTWVRSWHPILSPITLCISRPIGGMQMVGGSFGRGTWTLKGSVLKHYS